MRNEKKRLHVRDLRPKKSTNSHEIQRNFHNSENDNNEENRLIVEETNIENNSHEDNHLRINGSNIENGNNKSTVKSNQGKLAFILGDNMVKDVDSYHLLTGFINRKFNVKVKPFSSAKPIDIEDHTKPTKRDFNPDVYILHAGTNDLSLYDFLKLISNRIVDTAKRI